MNDTDDVATVGEAAYRKLRADIIEARLLPGERLTLDRLRSRYGISVGTLREILNRLMAEDLVAAEGQRGFEVARATETDLREIGQVRLLLESHALDRSFAQGDLEWEGRVVAAYHKLSSVERAMLAERTPQRTSTWINYDFGFHHALISACGSRTLLALHAGVFDRFLRYHMLASSFRGEAVALDHEALFNLALKRDVEGAKGRLAEHIEGGIEHVLTTGAVGRTTRTRSA